MKSKANKQKETYSINDSGEMTYLIIYNKLGIFIKHRVLSFSESAKFFQDFPRVNIGRRRVLKMVRLLNDRGNVAGVAMVNKVL